MTDLLQRAADEAAITRLLYAYCDAVDANRIDDIVALFTADAVFDLGYGRVYTGLAELARVFGQLGLYRFVWHPPLFNAALYVILLSAFVTATL